MSSMFSPIPGRPRWDHVRRRSRTKILLMSSSEVAPKNSKMGISRASAMPPKATTRMSVTLRKSIARVYGPCPDVLVGMGGSVHGSLILASINELNSPPAAARALRGFRAALCVIDNSRTSLSDSPRDTRRRPATSSYPESAELARSKLEDNGNARTGVPRRSGET